MRKRILILLLITGAFVLPDFIKNADAADFGIGIITFGNAWEPSYRDMYDDYKIDPLFMYGPVLSLTFFQDLTFTGLFMLNYPESDTDFNINFTGSNGAGVVACTGTSNRGDIDLSVQYRLLKNLNIFAGYKISNMTYHCKTSRLVTGSYTYSGSGEDQLSIGDAGVDLNGFALGFSVPVSLYEKLFLVPSLSLLYAQTAVMLKYVREKSAGFIETYTRGNDGGDATAYGFNTSLNLNYMFESINTTVSIGGRFQFYTYKDVNPDIKLTNDYFYGLVLSAMYIF